MKLPYDAKCFVLIGYADFVPVLYAQCEHLTDAGSLNFSCTQYTLPKKRWRLARAFSLFIMA